MNMRTFLVIAVAALGLAGCAGGPMLAEPAVTQSNVHQARQALATHELAPPHNMPTHEMVPTLDRIWSDVRVSVIQVCISVFGSDYNAGCPPAVWKMRLVLVPDESVNAYADPSNYTIGIHQGFMRSAGSEDEIAAVLAHEAAHLLFNHGAKKGRNALGYQILAGIVGIGMASQGWGNYTEELMETGWQMGYVSYSPEMELEADQFAVYVLNDADRRLSAASDLIVRLHRGDVPAPVRQGDGWAGYLATHPADDHRLAAMRSTLNDIRNGAVRPLSKVKREAQEHQQMAQQAEARRRTIFESAECVALRREYPDCKWWQGKYDWLYITRCPSPFGHACQ